MTLLELEIGVRRVERKDPRQAGLLKRWVDEHVRIAFEDRILPIDEVTAEYAAPLHVPDSAPHYDSLIAATALQHNLTLVTRNTKDFERSGVKLLNPWLL